MQGMEQMHIPAHDSAERPEGSSGERVADLIVRALERQIATGALPDGSPLPPERDLMARFGASRTVVREVVKALAHRGLVDHRPRFRPIVRKLGYRTVVDVLGTLVPTLLNESGGVKNLYDSRVFLERALVREAALHARREDIQALRAALTANERAIADSDAFYATDMAFHGVLYEIPRNPVLTAVHVAYTSWLSPHWKRMPRSPERNMVNHRSHRAILDAIVDRDPEAAEAALVSHLAAAWAYVRVTFDEESS
jgi:GntR family transcriptional regulator, sialic acid-inducible nan operon repressor